MTRIDSYEVIHLKTRRALWTGIAATFAMLLIILDAKTALTGANIGMELCLKTVIPSLYPFFVLSNLIRSSLIGQSVTILRPVGRFCGIPKGAESLMFLGLVGGYPVGARNVYQAYQSGQLTKSDAERMLGFCNNAGPAFIFGMVATLFSSPVVPWVLLGIQCVSAVGVAWILPGKSRAISANSDISKQNITAVIEQSTKTMAVVCGWVILFRVVITFAQRWIFWAFDPVVQVIIAGLLELSNGCLAMQTISSEATRFILSSCFLSLGGLCVALQTRSVVGDLSCRKLVIGKLLQCGLSFVVAGILQYILFPDSSIPLIIPATVAAIALPVLLQYRKKVVAFPCSLLYNKKKCETR